MPISIDFERLQIRASINDLLDEARTRGRGRGGSLPGALARLRAELGQRVHAAYRDRAKREHGNAFAAEQPVALLREIDGFAVHVHGRVDGIVRARGVVAIDEVKSVSLPGSELYQAAADDFSAYLLQLRLYALALIDAGEDVAALRLRLILVSLVDDARREFVVDVEPDATQRRLAGLVRVAVAAAERTRGRAARRRAVADAIVFPFAEVRRHQGAFMTAIRDGLTSRRPVLAMAPTGLGKTMGALVPALQHALRQGAAVEFLTAKRTQRSHVARAFEHVRHAAGERGRSLLAVTLRAKAEMCPPGHLVCHADVCPYLEGYTSRREPAAAVADWVERGGHVDAEEIYRVGVARRLCPFELALDLAATAELVIGDFNLRYGELLARVPGRGSAVVVIDEAHNLGERARQQLSPRVRASDVVLAKGRVVAGRHAQPSRVAAQLGLVGPMLGTRAATGVGRLTTLLDDILAWIESAALGVHSSITDPLADLVARSAAALFELAWQVRRSGAVRRRELVHDVLREVVRVGEVASAGARQLVPHVYGHDTGHTRAVGMVCLDPAPWLHLRHRTLGAVVAMSATLCPLEHHCRALGLASLDPVCIDVPSPFPASHRRIVIAPAVDTTYRHRAAYSRQIAELVCTTAKVRPGKYVVFFPSFAFLHGVWPHLRGFGGVLFRQTAQAPALERQQLVAEFRDRDGPALLVAVMGGALAEGLDFPGEQLVGAFIVGPGLPPVDAERERIAAHFQRETGQGFAHAYLHPGMQRVVQAAGRVIRTEHDRGIIVLVGQRFARSAYASCLPRHWYDVSPGELVAADPVAAVRRFWAGVDGGSCVGLR